MRYGETTTNKKRANEVAFSFPWNIDFPIEDYFFRLEECYVTALMVIPAYTMDQVVDKALSTIQPTGLFSQAVLEWNGLLLKNKT